MLLSYHNPIIPGDSKMTNHYGVYVNRDEPTTGVYQNNKIPWLHEKLDDGIDLQFVEHIDNCEICQNGNEYCDITDNWEMGTVLRVLRYYR